MSDIFEGPGYWMASDAKWYPPEQHPDPSYRARFVTAQAVESAAPEQTNDLSVDAVDDSGPATGEFPTVELSPNEIVSPGSAGLSEIHSNLESTTGDTASSVRVPDDSIRAAPPAFSVKSNTFDPAPERPVFEQSSPRSVVSSPHGSAPENTRPKRTRIELEVDRPSVDAPRSDQPGRNAPPPRLSSSTALAVIPAAAIAEPGITIVDRLLAALVFCAGVAMIVGTFLDWTTGSLEQTGWDRGDGIATVIAGVIGSAVAGPIYVGYRHIVPKSIAIVAGLVGLVVVGLTAISVLSDSASADTSLGIGFIMVLAGSAAMTGGGLLHRVELSL